MQDPICNMQWNRKDNFQGSISNFQLESPEISNLKFQISNEEQRKK